MTRRWQAGTTVTAGPFELRVVDGRKGAGDLRLEVLTADGWMAVPMVLGAVVADFFCENEDHLGQFRPHWRSGGGDFFMAYLQEARFRGWQVAEARLQGDKERRGAA